MSLTTNLDVVADKVLEGKSQAAFHLPADHLIKTHVLISLKVNGMSPQKLTSVREHIFTYFKGLSRYQCGIMWLTFLTLAKERCTQWFHSDIKHQDLMCNSFFCKGKYVNGRRYSTKVEPADYWSKCESLVAILYGKVTEDGFTPARPEDIPKSSRNANIKEADK